MPVTIEQGFSRLTAWVYGHKFSVLFLLLVCTLVLAIQSSRLTFDTRDESFFRQDDPTLVSYNDFRDRFGQDDTFIVSLKPEGGLTSEFFALLFDIHKDLEDAVPYLDDISSLVNGRIIRAEGDTLIVGDLMEHPPASHEERQRVLALVDRYPMYDRLLISPDRTMATIMIKAQAVKAVAEEEVMSGFDTPAPSDETDAPLYLSNDENIEINTAISRVLDAYQEKGVTFYKAGTPVFVAEITAGIMEDLRVTVPLSLLLIILFLTLLFRKISGVIYPLLVVVLSLISTLGIMALAGIAVSTVVQILPTFLIVVGIADSVHILTLFYHRLGYGDHKQDAIIRAVGKAGLPVFMTTITTACGLFSFVWADVASVAQLGYLAPVGVMLAFIYTLLLLPALIAIFPVKQPKPLPPGKHPLMDNVFMAITRFTVNRPFAIICVSCVITLGAAFSAVTVRFSHNAMTWFPQGTPIRESTEVIDHVNGGSVMLEITIDTGQENGLHQPEFLQRLDTAAEKIPDISAHRIRAAKAWSLADVLKEINRALNQDNDDAYTLPQTSELAAQELILFESSGSDDLEDFTDSQYQTARLSILAPFTDSVLYKDYVDKVREYLDQAFPNEHVALTGHMMLFIQITKNFIASMLKSYGVALILITVLMMLMLGSIRIGAMSIVANVVPIVVVFGLMGILDIPLDMGTILIGSIVLGLVVDDTIHFLHHFRRAFDSSGDTQDAIRETLFSTGRALVITSAVLCAGFFTYTLSFLSSNIRFGLLSGCAVLFALVADFLLVPALLTLIYRKGKSK